MKIVVSLLVAAGAVLLLLAWSGVRGGDFVEAYAAIDGRGFGAFLGLQALVYVLRGLRLRSLVHAVGHVPVPRLDAPRAVAAATAWTFDGQVLPARLGEASLVLHLGRLGV